MATTTTLYAAPVAQGPKQQHILSVLVANRFGVLARVSALFARRGYNIESLAVSPTEDPTRSRITIVVDVASTPLEQITKQLFKLIDVLKITELAPADAVERELMLIAVRADAQTRGNVVELVQVFEGTIVDVGHDSLTVSLSGRPDKLDDLTELLRPFGILETQRTGLIALAKRERSARSKTSTTKAS